MNIEEITNSIKTKLGDEEAGKIADDLATLLINDKTQKDTMKSKDEEIKQLKSDKDVLISANSNLLMKVTAGKESDEDFGNPKGEDEKTKPFDFRKVFENGKFKR